MVVRDELYLKHGGLEYLDGGTHGIQFFGYSLAGNMDIDGNGYPDLAVGSLSNNVTVFRAKPVIHVVKTLTLAPSEIDYLGKDCQKGRCDITAHYCLSFTTHPATYNPRIKILSTLVIDKDNIWDVPRMTIHSSTWNSLVLQQQGQRSCSTSTLRLRGNIRDKVTDIPVRLSLSLSPDNPSQTVSQSSLPPLSPILQDSEDDDTSTVKFKFLNTGCGSDGICHSNLQLQYSFCTKVQQRDECIPLTRKDGLAAISPGNKDTALQITVTNKGGDSAHDTQLFADFPESLPLSDIIPAKGATPDCKVNQNTTQCLLGNPLKRDTETTYYLMLNTDRLSADTTDINVPLRLKTVPKPSQVFFGEAVKEERAITSEDEIGTPVQYEFRVSSMGRPLKSFASATLYIQWPKKNQNGRWLLYLMRITDARNQTISCTPAAEINPLKHIKETPRGKRQAEGEGKVDALTTDGFFSLFGGKKYKYLTCADEMSCVELKCPLQEVDRTEVVILSARLWSSTFAEEYSSLNYLDIVLNASISLEGSQQNLRLRGSQTQVRLTVFPEKKPTFLSRAPWWVILLSVVLALLLIALLIYMLSKGSNY
ncbi:hypothetical protein NFI96_004258 [Prochilodus magdalenae]|nr:hypothetical protein NFI96_004258 [Prochilodus magdalenae]